MSDLVPPDFKRCQAECLEGSFMTLGPRSMVRCPNAPKFLATELVAGTDGRCGSMTLCQDCAKVMMDRPDISYSVQLTPITYATGEVPNA